MSTENEIAEIEKLLQDHEIGRREELLQLLQNDVSLSKREIVLMRQEVVLLSQEKKLLKKLQSKSLS